MTNLYVNTSSGSDVVAKASNTVNAPWKSLTRAIKDATASTDTIIVDAPDADNAVRGMPIVDKDLTIKATTGQEMFISASFPAMQDEVYELLTEEDYCDALPSSSGFTTVFTQAAAVDAVGQLMGTGCILLEGSVNTSGMRQSVAYRNGQPKRFRIIYKADIGGTIDLQVRGSSEDFNFTTETWVTAAYQNVLPSTGAWTEYVTPWIDGQDDSGQLTFRAFGSQDARVQRVIVEYKQEWTLGTTGDEEGKYSILWSRPIFATDYEVNTGAFGDHLSAPILFKCTQAEWEANGELALDVVDGTSDTGETLAALTKGKYFYDHGTGLDSVLYYYPLDSETFSDLHFELLASGDGVHITSACTLKNPRVFATQAPIRVDSTGTVEIYGARETATATLGFLSINTGTTNFYNPVSEQVSVSPSVKWRGGGFLCGIDSDGALAVMNIYGGKVVYAGDDSYQPIGAGTLNLYGCTSHMPAGSAIEMNCNEVGGGMTINGFTGLNAEIDGNSLRDQSTATVTVSFENCAFEAMAFEGGTKTYTVGTSVHSSDSAGSGGALPAAVTNNVNWDATFDFEDETNGDYTPSTTSDLFEARIDPFDNTWHVGADSEPFMQIKGDAGGIQSKHSRQHPAYDGD